MNTVKKDPSSDIWGAVLRFEELTNRLCRIERLMRLLACSQCVSESSADAIEGLADLVDACREESVKCQDEFAALSGSYRETAQ
ncbi:MULTISPECIES: hypothetical protein [unclassified Croceicoccus]|uniref:hypothetical protein n=1 Tax=unclassified Croceicoccus TaxID=2629967 RepID=UPI001E2D7B46|nr:MULTISPECIES: hypothetical protein [unclassified Croceicoccus]